MQANIYENEGNDQQAYLLLFRHAHLVLQHLVYHPEAKDPENRRALETAKREVQSELSRLEALKPSIENRYVEHRRRILAEDQSRAQHPTDSAPTAPEARDIPDATPSIEPAENRDLAVRLAKREIHRRAEVKGQYPRSQHAAGDALETRLHGLRSRPATQESTRDISTSTARPLNKVIPSEPSPEDLRTTTRFKYPEVPRPSPFNSMHGLGYAINQPFDHARPLIPESTPAPPVPSKTKRDQVATNTLGEFSPTRRPLLPDKTPITADAPPLIPQKVPLPQKTVPPAPSQVPKANGDSEPNPSTLVFKPSAYLENGTPLRTIFISPNLRKRFLAMAASNTNRNLETCGMLCGTLISNAFFISRLVIPDQTSTSDTCEMVNESALFDYCDSEDLMVLGWIHTHPTQTCFMSSRDLHTHSGYQAMLAESIAIVCAPTKHPDWGIFRLTDPPGLRHVLGCTKPGNFHPHSETNLYTDAIRPGHVFDAPGLEFEVADLRSS